MELSIYQSITAVVVLPQGVNCLGVGMGAIAGAGKDVDEIFGVDAGFGVCPRG